MSASTFDIDEQFIDKDESRFVYRERGDGSTRVLIGDLPHFTKTVSLGAMTHWEDGTPISDEPSATRAARFASPAAVSTSPFRSPHDPPSLGTARLGGPLA
jgi:hypothetical protein